MAKAGTMLGRALTGVAVLAALVAAAPLRVAAEQELAEVRYRYLTPETGANPLVARWTALGAVMPKWKEKGRLAHYRFAPGVDGRQCDQKDCHPGFRDEYVSRVVALPEGATREEAQERRHGGSRCGDCHHAENWPRAAPSHRVHDDDRERIGCETCHAMVPKVPVAVGEARRLTLRDFDQRLAWPAHELARVSPEQEVAACVQICHVPQNPLGVARACEDCHGKGKFEVASYTATPVLVHATAKASILPPLTGAFFKVLTVVVLGALFLYILLEIVRVRKEEAP